MGKIAGGRKERQGQQAEGKIQLRFVKMRIIPAKGRCPETNAVDGGESSLKKENSRKGYNPGKEEAKEKTPPGAVGNAHCTEGRRACVISGTV